MIARSLETGSDTSELPNDHQEVRMKRSESQKVIVLLPFDGYDEWDAEIESSIERDIERLENEEGADEDFLASLKQGDVDYDPIYDEAAKEYVAQFDELASEELGIKLSLRLESWNERGIYASMPIAVAKRLLGPSDKKPQDLGAFTWNELFCDRLSDVDDTTATIFAHLAESTDVFYPM